MEEAEGQRDTAVDPIETPCASSSDERQETTSWAVDILPVAHRRSLSSKVSRAGIPLELHRDGLGGWETLPVHTWLMIQAEREGYDSAAEWNSMCTSHRGAAADNRLGGAPTPCS